jgi:hypothetical protein
MKAPQAKYLNFRLAPVIKLAQATVEEKLERNLERKVLLAEDNLEIARATRNKVQETIFDEVAMDEDRAPLTPNSSWSK